MTSAGESFRPLLLLIGAVAVAACAERPAEEEPAAAAPIVVIDDAGREVRANEPPERIVSLVPAVTDLVLALGLEDRLVARTDYDTASALAELPSVGGGLTPSVEWIVERRPDLVVAWPDQGARSVVGRLAAMGVPVYGSAVQTLEQAESAVARLGRLLGAQAASDSLLAAWDAELDAVRRRVAGRERPSVAYVIGLDPPMVAGPGSFVDELIEIAGARNAFADAGALWPQVSLEELVRRQPDVVVLAGGPAGSSPGRLRALPGWRELDAIRQGRVHRVDSDIFNRFVHAPAAAGRLAALLHPLAPADPAD